MTGRAGAAQNSEPEASRLSGDSFSFLCPFANQGMSLDSLQLLRPSQVVIVPSWQPSIPSKPDKDGAPGRAELITGVLGTNNSQALVV